MNGDIRIVVLDRHPLVRAGLAHHLSGVHGIIVDAEFGALQEMMAHPALESADVVVVDCFAGDEALAAGALLGAIRTCTDSRIVVFTSWAGRGVRALCAQAGADAFIDKRAPVGDVVQAIRNVLGSRRRRTPAAGIDFLMSGLGRLTANEDRVMRMVAEGKSTAEIAGYMRRTKSTVSSHKINALRKMQLAGEREFLRLLPPDFAWPERPDAGR